MQRTRFAVACGAAVLCASWCALCPGQSPASAAPQRLVPFDSAESKDSQFEDPNVENWGKHAQRVKPPGLNSLELKSQRLQPFLMKPLAVKQRQNDSAGVTEDPSRSIDLQKSSAAAAIVLDRNMLEPFSTQPGRRLVSNDGKIQLVSDETLLVPVEVEPPPENVELESEDGFVNLVATDAELRSVLRMIADYHKLNLVLGPEVGGPVTVSIRDARLEEVLDAILGVAGFAWHRVNNLLYVTGASASGMDPRVQGRSLQVYPLDYVSAAEVESVANGLLSPVGNAYVSESDAADELKTRELLVVEDTPAAHARIAQYIAQIDIAPRQVMVEAHVLQIALSEEDRHGVDLRALTRIEHSSLTLEGKGFTDTSSGEPGLTLRVDGSDMGGVIELIRRHTNSRTLASPKLSVVNHQEAKIQIGQRLPYSVATTTQTTTVQSVEFLEVGIVLTVRPVITADGNVLMYVLPKVSGGKITQNGFPEEETTEVETTILIPDGGGIIIGGLIREENLQSRAIVPYFGRIPVLGHLFRQRDDEVRRNELIVALVTHVIPECYGPRSHEAMELQQALPDYAAGELMHPVTGY